MERLIKKLKDLNQNELEDYVKKLHEENPNDKPLIKEMDKKVGQMLNTGQEPVCQLLHFETYEETRIAYLDHYVPLIDCLKGAYLTKCEKASEFIPELLIPSPDTLEIEPNDMLTPFPFIVEMPALNPSFNIKELLVDILDDAGKADINKLKVG